MEETTKRVNLSRKTKNKCLNKIQTVVDTTQYFLRGKELKHKKTIEEDYESDFVTDDESVQSMWSDKYEPSEEEEYESSEEEALEIYKIDSDEELSNCDDDNGEELESSLDYTSSEDSTNSCWVKKYNKEKSDLQENMKEMSILQDDNSSDCSDDFEENSRMLAIRMKKVTPIMNINIPTQIEFKIQKDSVIGLDEERSSIERQKRLVLKEMMIKVLKTVKVDQLKERNGYSLGQLRELKHKLGINQTKKKNIIAEIDKLIKQYL